MADASPGRTDKIWRDGEFVNWDDATLHVMSHVVHYGSSVFEGLRCYDTPAGGAVFRLQDHMRRFLDSARIYRMPVRYTVDDLVQATIDTVAANDLRECYLRPVLVRTGQQMSFHPVGVPVECFIIAYKWPTYLSADALERGVDACVSSWRRAAPDTLPMMAKAGGNYLSSQQSTLEARQNGYSEGIMLDSFGFVAEGSGANLFLVRDGVLYTAGLGSGILHGITRDTIMTLARDFGYEVREQQIPREMLYIADELFFTGTAAELTPIRSVDRVEVGKGEPGEITRRLQAEFLGIAKGSVVDRFGWLTPVPAAVVSR
ncbi:MAG: branched-chain amino acid transaminase [Gemmatimonadetes bacterium]|jgi:branched-chain amino acid aminotransferase|nr:branched-chain amino acid transaminase [Gemmatimonadota bacterium]MCC6774303.1 branched-chain amino acid transaminase [Gemmatimonadaceae bacterium]